MSQSTTEPTTLFVTGASRELGLELTSELLEQGHNVVATTRSTDRLTAALTAHGIGDTSNLLALEVSLSDEQQVRSAVAAATERFGQIDVVVNNAGYGFLAAVEEVTDAEARQMFDVQIFGVWNVLRATLPHMRTRRAGHVINISSILGLTTFPGVGPVLRRQVRTRRANGVAGGRGGRVWHPGQSHRTRLHADRLPGNAVAGTACNTGTRVH